MNGSGFCHSLLFYSLTNITKRQESTRDRFTIAGNVPGLCEGWELESCRSLGRKLIFVTAKLLKLIRITNAEWLLLQPNLRKAVCWLQFIFSVWNLRCLIGSERNDEIIFVQYEYSSKISYE